MLKLKELQQMRQNKNNQPGGEEGRPKRVNPAEIRLQKDLSELELPQGCSLTFPKNEDTMHFIMHITPTEGFYKDASFNFSVNISNSYPYDPPRVVCSTLVYHPNIDYHGHVNLNILRQDWSPLLSLTTVCFGLLFLFANPNGMDPLNRTAGEDLIKSPKSFEKNVNASLRGGIVDGRQFPKLL
eukprot:TRINITY_DN11223_c0_g1_i1.p1 TRINITY_DN11223_c0_g1~~TRINITY_DN11223_c0_g1_i1.p1  ORF type:complete len:214 (-),score=41.86 TRINITY_DN11223_c0_g1_i1:164-715(-)